MWISLYAIVCDNYTHIYLILYYILLSLHTGKSGSGDNCMTINGVKKCCSGGTLSWKNEKFHCSGEKSAAKGVNPMWMGMLLMMGILVQLY